MVSRRIEAARDLREAIHLLEHVLVECSIDDNGSVVLSGRRQLVERVSGLSVVVLPREHPPPHFHVVGSGINASFSVVDGSHIAGRISAAKCRAIQFWYKSARSLLIEAWNATRPANCPVGPIAKTDT